MGNRISRTFRFMDPNQNGIFHQTQANFEANSQFRQIQAEFSTKSTEFHHIEV